MMQKRLSRFVLTVLLVGAAAALTACGEIVSQQDEVRRHDAALSTELFPNLNALPAKDLRLEEQADGVTLLRFSTTSWNSGAGPLELVAGAVDEEKKKQQVWQRVYVDDGTYETYSVGHFTWHEDHDHFHFDDYADYLLYDPDDPNDTARSRVGQKTSFCIIDTDRIDHKLDGAPKRRVYTGCDNTIQGMSVGWGDTYGHALEGQHIDVTGLDAGVYHLEIHVNPKGRLKESDHEGNVSTVRIYLDLASSSVTIVADDDDGDDDGDDEGGGGPGNGRCPRC